MISRFKFIRKNVFVGAIVFFGLFVSSAIHCMQLAIADNSNEIKIWDVEEKKVIHTLKGSVKISSLLFSPDEKMLLAGNEIWDTKTWKSIKKFEKVSAAAFSPDGKYLAISWGEERASVKINILSTDKWKLIKILELESDIVSVRTIDLNIMALAFSPTESLLVAKSEEGQIKIWETNNWKEVKNLSIGGGSRGFLVFSPDGKFLVTSGSRLIRAQVLTTRDWKAIDTKKARWYLSKPTAVAFSLNGNYLISSDSIHITKLNTTDWNMEMKKRVPGGSDAFSFSNISFESSGKSFAFGDDLGNIHIWDIDDLNKGYTFNLGEEEIEAVAFKKANILSKQIKKSKKTKDIKK